MRRRVFLAGALAAACTLPGRADTERPPAERVAALLSGMSLADRVAQCMSVAFHGTRITSHLERMIHERHVGGVIVFHENAADAAALRRLADDLQRIARAARIPPLLIAIDQEGGAVTRIGAGLAVLPGQMALAATADPAASVRRAVAIAATELRALGVNWNLAPVADVNDEPRNPIIGNRSFGSDPARVGELVAIAVRAYADAALLSCVKHFPGHGATTVDSHTGLPELAVGRTRLDAVELAPFRAAIAAGAPAIMTAHVRVPALDAAPDRPATLSSAVLDDLLRRDLGFRGLVVSDDLEMGALASVGGEARAALAALRAGADYLLFRFDESAQLEGHRLATEAAASASLPAARLDAAARAVLDAKARWGVLAPGPRASFDLAADRAAALDVARGATTLLRNRGTLPLRGTALVIAPTDADLTRLDQPTLADVVAQAHRPTEARALPLHGYGSERSALVASARAADVVVVGIADAHLDPPQIELVRALAATKPTVVVSLRAPYDAEAVIAAGADAHVVAYDGREPSLRAAVEVMTGMRPPRGRLPVAIPGLYRIGEGMQSL